MKRVLYLLPVLCLIVFACKKDKKNNPEKSEGMLGLWRLYQYSPGTGPVVWTTTTEYKTIFFRDDLVFISNAIKGDHYLLTPGTDTLLKIYNAGGKDTVSYFVKLRPNALILQGCIEGCSEKYGRMGMGAILH